MGYRRMGVLQNRCCNAPSYINENGIQKQLCNKECQEINNFGVVWRGRSPSILIRSSDMCGAGL